MRNYEPPYWIDAGVLIQSVRGPYRPERVSKFWSFIDGKVADGIIKMPLMAWNEVIDGNDWLAKWCANREGTGLCTAPSRKAQIRNRDVCTFVQTQHKVKGDKRHAQHQIAEFFKGADTWIIAHALAEGGTVVTHEDRERPNEAKIKIPDVAKAMGARWRDTYTMLDELDMRL